jgi:flagellar motility protein MotE (MotC chaperone)
MSGPAQKRSRAARKGLTVIATLLAASAAIRFGAGPATAIAREVANLEAPGAALSDAGCQTPEDVTLALEALAEREERLVARRAEVDARIALLDEAEAAMEATLTELEDAEAELQATLSVASSAAENDIARLTAVYETMKPKQAAALFEQMDPEFAAGFLGRMRPEAAAAVMAGLDPQTGYTISVMLAARNADVPKD